MEMAPVLYVEDDPNDALFMELAFMKAKVIQPLKILTNGEQAIQYFKGVDRFANRQEHPLPCLLLLDLKLPLKSGLEVLAWLREQEAFKNLPVIVYTSSANEKDMARAKALGAQEYLLKQSTPPETARQVEELKRHWLAGSVRDKA